MSRVDEDTWNQVGIVVIQPLEGRERYVRLSKMYNVRYIRYVNVARKGILANREVEDGVAFWADMCW